MHIQGNLPTALFGNYDQTNRDLPTDRRGKWEVTLPMIMKHNELNKCSLCPIKSKVSTRLIQKPQDLGAHSPMEPLALASSFDAHPPRVITTCDPGII